MTTKLKLIAGLSAALLIAGCDGGGGGGGGDDDGEVSGIDTLGAAFVAMFAADANDAPVDAQEVPLEVDPTGDPFNP